VLAWHETVYYSETVAALPARGASLGLAGAPACRDALGGEAGASRAVEVSSIAGVDPRLAIAALDDAQHGYFAAGYFVQLPSHPLHPYVVEPPACANGSRVSLVGIVERNAGSLTLRGRRVLVDSRTRIEQLSRDGLPYVGVGRKVAVEALLCRGRLVARRISPAGSA
jgi:Domain of unknown function (DUF5666)